jgi:hypothetical protein
VFVVQTSDGGTEGFDTGRGTILAGGGGDGDGGGTRETALDLVVGFRSTLAEIGPGGRVLRITMFGGAFRTPDDTG